MNGDKAGTPAGDEPMHLVTIDWARGTWLQCQILVDVESDDYWLRQRTEAHQRMVAIFLAAQAFSDQPCKLLKPAVSRIRESGAVDLYALPLTGAVRVAGRRPDTVLKDADGIVVRDTKRERIERRNALALQAAAHVNDSVANSILRSYSAALNDPDNELIHLYEIRDALSSQFVATRLRKRPSTFPVQNFPG